MSHNIRIYSYTHLSVSHIGKASLLLHCIYATDQQFSLCKNFAALLLYISMTTFVVSIGVSIEYHFGSWWLERIYLIPVLSQTPNPATSGQLIRQGRLTSYCLLAWAALTAKATHAPVATGSRLRLFVFYGIYKSLVDGTQRAFAADLIPAEQRGSAFGLYYTLLSLATLPSSVIAGFLWDSYGASTPFYFGTILAFIVVLLMVLFKSRLESIGKTS